MLQVNESKIIRGHLKPVAILNTTTPWTIIPRKSPYTLNEYLEVFKSSNKCIPTADENLKDGNNIVQQYEETVPKHRTSYSS